MEPNVVIKKEKVVEEGEKQKSDGILHESELRAMCSRMFKSHANLRKRVLRDEEDRNDLYKRLKQWEEYGEKTRRELEKANENVELATQTADKYRNEVIHWKARCERLESEIKRLASGSTSLKAISPLVQTSPDRLNQARGQFYDGTTFDPDAMGSSSQLTSAHMGQDQIFAPIKKEKKETQFEIPETQGGYDAESYRLDYHDQDQENMIIPSSPPSMEENRAAVFATPKSTANKKRTLIESDIDQDLLSGRRRTNIAKFNEQVSTPTTGPRPKDNPPPRTIETYFKSGKHRKDKDGHKEKETDLANIEDDSEFVRRLVETVHVRDFILNPQSSSKAYAETVKGNKRWSLPGSSCEQCNEFFKAMGQPPDPSKCKHISANQEIHKNVGRVSRHRQAFAAEPDPPHFWNPDMPTTQEEILEKKDLEKFNKSEAKKRMISAVELKQYVLRDLKLRSRFDSVVWDDLDARVKDMMYDI